MHPKIPVHWKCKKRRENPPPIQEELKMIFADKLIENRKKNGWSQEDLAYKLGVSRQSVSKWESAQAIPDMKKILQMADLFGVSTDYLLRDEIEDSGNEPVPVDVNNDDPARRVSLEEATAFLQHNQKASHLISTGVMLCILSPILLIVLSELSEAGLIPFSEAVCSGTGTVVLLVLIAIAVVLFLTAYMRGKPYSFLENEKIDTEYGVSGMVKEYSANYAETHSRLMIIGILFCVISAIPLFLMNMFSSIGEEALSMTIGISGMLAAIAVGVKLIALTSIHQEGFEKLLEEGDYTRLNKRIGKYDGIYWAIATAVYLTWSFLTMRWQATWIVWPIAGVIYAAYREILKLTVDKK